MDVMLREFGRCVEDDNRTDAFARAIAEDVRPGDVVVDVGTGFGLLALLAARQGAVAACTPSSKVPGDRDVGDS